jgi:hypothetical protein
MRLRRLAKPTIAVLAAALMLPAPASADFQTLYDDYRADGVINGCAFSSAELSSGLGEIPADVREYDPGFSEAINAALEQSASGCGQAPQEAARAIKNEITAADGSPGPAIPKAFVFAHPDDGRGLPAVLVGLMVLLGLALGTAALLGAAHYRGWDLRRRLAPASGAVRGVERRLAESLRSLRDRLGF